MRKILSSIVIAVIVLLVVMGIVSAATTFNVELTSDFSKYSQGDKVLVSINLKDFTPGKTGINAFVAKLVYDRKVFNVVKTEDIVTEYGWSDVIYNESEGLFVTTNDKFITDDHAIVRITFNVRNGAQTGDTNITLKDINAADGDYDIFLPESSITLKIDGDNPVDLSDVEEIKTNTNGMFIIIGVVALVAVIAIIAFILKRRNNK